MAMVNACTIGNRLLDAMKFHNILDGNVIGGYAG